MKAYVCNHCKNIIDEDDIEAIEIKQPYTRALFSSEEFVPALANENDENQNVHYCGKCKTEYFCEWI